NEESDGENTRVSGRECGPVRPGSGQTCTRDSLKGFVATYFKAIINAYPKQLQHVDHIMRPTSRRVAPGATCATCGEAPPRHSSRHSDGVPDASCRDQTRMITVVTATSAGRRSDSSSPRRDLDCTRTRSAVAPDRRSWYFEPCGGPA